MALWAWTSVKVRRQDSCSALAVVSSSCISLVSLPRLLSIFILSPFIHLTPLFALPHLLAPLVLRLGSLESLLLLPFLSLGLLLLVFRTGLKRTI